MKPERSISPFTWSLLPREVCAYIESLEQALAALIEKDKLRDQLILDLTRNMEELEARLNKNSSNSSKPPSSDPPYGKPGGQKKDKSDKKKRGAKQGHKGHRQVMLDPTEVMDIKPSLCRCGSHHLNPCGDEPFYTHQVIELPTIPMEVTHLRLFKTRCRECGATVKGRIPPESRTGYGPRLSALVAELSGPCGESRETVREFIHSVLGVPISLGGIQRIIDRASAAIEPIYEAIANEARTAPLNFIDETSWKTEFKLKWLWVMANPKVAFFMIHNKRSYDAFLELVDVWEGILVSDDYALYRKWVHLRQACLAHLIRHARGLAQRRDPEIAGFGRRMESELSRLCGWAEAPPTMGQWNAFYARFVGDLRAHCERKDKAGNFALRLTQELDDLWLFLWQNGVEPTNNRAERALRFPVIWRKRSLGTQSQKGDRWVERILSLKQTCRMHRIPTFPILVQSISDYLKEQHPDLAWISDLG